MDIIRYGTHTHTTFVLQCITPPSCVVVCTAVSVLHRWARRRALFTFVCTMSSGPPPFVDILPSQRKLANANFVFYTTAVVFVTNPPPSLHSSLFRHFKRKLCCVCDLLAIGVNERFVLQILLSMVTKHLHRTQIVQNFILFCNYYAYDGSDSVYYYYFICYCWCWSTCGRRRIIYSTNPSI